MNESNKQKLIGVLDSEMADSSFKRYWIEATYARKVEIVEKIVLHAKAMLLEKS